MLSTIVSIPHRTRPFQGDKDVSTGLSIAQSAATPPPDSPESRSPASPQAAVEVLLAGLKDMTVDAEVTVGVAQAAGVTARDLKVTLVPDGLVPAGAAP